MVAFVVRGNAPQDAERLLGCRGLDEHALEPPFEGRVALDVGAVFVECRGADGLQLAAGEHRFEDVGRIETPLGRSGPYDRVDLVDEDDRVARAAKQVEQLLHALLELAAEFRAGNQGRDVERKDPLAGDGGGNLAPCDPQREPLDDGALAHARLADQDRIVLLAPREDLDDAVDLAVAADDRIDLSVACELREICAELCERVARRLLDGTLRGFEPGLAYRYLGAEVVACGEALQLFGDDLRGDAVHLQHVGRRRRAVARNREQGVPRGDAPHGVGGGAQLLGKPAVECVGGIPALLALDGVYFVLDAQPYLVELPVPEPGRQELKGERTLLAEQFQREKILERVGDSRLRRVEGRTGDEPLQRFRNFQLHGASSL